RSLEQLRRELREILAPVDPGMTACRFLVVDVEAVLLQHRDGRLRRIEQEVVLAGREPDETEVVLRGGIVELCRMRGLPARVVRDAEDAGAENSDVAVAREIAERDVERLRTAHRQTRDRGRRAAFA